MIKLDYYAHCFLDVLIADTYQHHSIDSAEGRECFYDWFAPTILEDAFLLFEYLEPEMVACTHHYHLIAALFF